MTPDGWRIAESNLFLCYNHFMFDTLTYAKKLKEAGFEEKQAEVLILIQSEVIDERLVTKEHFDLRMKEFDFKIKELELKIEGRFASVAGELTLLKWMMGVVIAGILSLVLKTFFVA